MRPLQIHPDIRRAATLPASFYRDSAIFEQTKEKIFATTWQYAADVAALNEAANVYPFTLLPGVLDEPLLLSRADGRWAARREVRHRAGVGAEPAG